METNNGKIKPIVYLGVVRDGKILLVQYTTPPNPSRSGWWIPAPELVWGEDPTEKARQIQRELGLEQGKPVLSRVESFVTPGGWHLVFHHLLTSGSEVRKSKNIKDFLWVSETELLHMDDLAHGSWEKEVAQAFLLEAGQS